MGIDKDDDRYEPSTTRSTLPEQERKYFVEFPCYKSDTYWFDVNAYVDSIVKNVNEEIERRLADIGYIKVIRCKDCKHYIKSDAEHPDCDFCKRLICGVIRPDFFCADGERKEETK